MASYSFIFINFKIILFFSIYFQCTNVHGFDLNSNRCTFAPNIKILPKKPTLVKERLSVVELIKKLTRVGMQSQLEHFYFENGLLCSTVDVCLTHGILYNFESSCSL